jgi:ComF family protein
MGGLLAECLRAQGVSGDILVPVPLHPRRLRQRGYNQAELVAREVGRRLGVPVGRGVLKRVRHSLPQARAASREERHANVAGAFQSRRELHGLRVLVLDDVTTTGATLAACATVLQAAGVESVWGVAFAKEL